MQHYIYDGSGERVLKANSDMEAVYENGELVNTPGTVSINGYTSYPSAFIVITADGVYSKHYYAGTQRIVSRLGDNDASIFESGCVGCKQEPSATPFDDNKLKQAQIQDLNVFAEKAKKGKVTLKEYKPISVEEQEKAMAEYANRAFAPPSGAGGLYYYHPDHLGTSTALTDFNGNAYQFFLNLPFGETMAQQLGSNYYNSPFKFNGKELDEETGFYYYGARYYDPKISLWLSVDPLAEEFPEWSPYAFCNNNPLFYIDPSGMSAEDNDWHPDKKTGNLIADAGDSTKSLAEYQGISYDQAAKQLKDNGYTVNDKGILNLNVGDSVNTGSFNLQEVVVKGKTKGSSSNSSTPWMDTAESQLGVKERTNNNDGVQVEKYLKSVGLGPGKNSYWCGAFVNWTLNESGIEGVKKPSWALNWRKFGESLDQPAFGAIATKTRNGGGHVGFVAGKTPNGSIVLLGGNQNNSVNYTAYPASILKYNYPKGYKPSYILPTIKIKNGKTREQ